MLSHNHTIYDLPAGTVIEMFSDEYCTGDATVIAQVWTQKLTCALKLLLISESPLSKKFAPAMTIIDS